MKKEFDAEHLSKMATCLHSLHHGNEPLVVPNAWDAVSAKIFENAGFPTIATTSSGISWSCGYKDGEHIPPQLMKNVLGRIAQNVKVPVTADIEGGYHHKGTAELADYIGELIQEGIVGINLEDIHAAPSGLNPLEDQLDKIKAIKLKAKELGVDLFVNARTDVMDLDIPTEDKIKIGIERAQAFKEAGADGIFIPFIKEIKVIEAFKKGIDLPLNILMDQNLSLPDLKSLGVNRISIGSKPILATLKTLTQLAEAVRQEKDWSMLYTDKPGYLDVNGWF